MESLWGLLFPWTGDEHKWEQWLTGGGNIHGVSFLHLTPELDGT
jgi:hypothetical protein